MFFLYQIHTTLLRLALHVNDEAPSVRLACKVSSTFYFPALFVLITWCTLHTDLRVLIRIRTPAQKLQSIQVVIYRCLILT